MSIHLYYNIPVTCFENICLNLQDRYVIFQDTNVKLQNLYFLITFLILLTNLDANIGHHHFKYLGFHI